MALCFQRREECVAFLKSLWTDRPQTCPKCGEAMLDYLHKGAKRRNCDRKCPACGEMYRTIRILDEMNEIMK